MANTGVLPFVRGVDFTSNDFSVSNLISSNLEIDHLTLNISIFQGLTVTLNVFHCLPFVLDAICILVILQMRICN